MSQQSLINLSKEHNFQQEVNIINLPVLVDFWAPWCGPCKIFAPIIDVMAIDYKDKIKIIKVNVDNFPDISAKFSIKSIPTFIIFKNGKTQKTQVGSIQKNELYKIIDQYI